MPTPPKKLDLLLLSLRSTRARLAVPQHPCPRVERAGYILRWIRKGEGDSRSHAFSERRRPGREPSRDSASLGHIPASHHLRSGRRTPAAAGHASATLQTRRSIRRRAQRASVT
ncbi:uncharacterized protein C8Q71DRAFT_780328 [Rhodofomes roseus]|uniref:Uncharacterized protein n=1 Tax=Rhodofomes roseus TaxID=34475 RepID=A0ABQ8K4G1_9APHY|nr:uncharacterized protein C8Q71DRAFT_780328 [Rhodofomes roseus]KAH9831789.1 hypothetical protein C8Q71DRAFT_780328 [Rhodofomes roseus]